MSFYMSLACDSSRGFYPDNRIGKFTTLLSWEVVLDGEYEVGLSELVMPIVRKSRNQQESIMYTEYSSAPGYFRINTSQLMSPDDFHDLQMPKTESGTPVFSFIVRGEKVVMTVAPGCIVYFMEVSPEIVSILGFEYGNYSGGLEGRQITALFPFKSRGVLSFVYVYCNIIEYSYVGDSMVPCLRALSVIPGDDRFTVLRFENPHYTPVSKSRFSTATVEIADKQAEEVQFSKGLSMVRLHFRPKKKLLFHW